MVPLIAIKKPCDLFKNFECDGIIATMTIMQPLSSNGVQMGLSHFGLVLLYYMVWNY
jgi:hypothetical protein